MGEMKKVDESGLKGKDLVEWRRQQVAQELKWWGKANSDGPEAGEAAERVLAIMRQRATLLGLGSGGRGAVQVTAGAMAAAPGGVNTEGPIPAGASCVPRSV